MGDRNAVGKEAFQNGEKLSRALNDKNYQAQEELKRKIIQTLDVPSFSLSSFDARVVDDFRKQLVKMAEDVTVKLASPPPSYATKGLRDVLRVVMEHPPMTSLRDIESQIDVLPQNENEVRQVMEALGS